MALAQSRLSTLGGRRSSSERIDGIAAAQSSL